MKTAEEMYDYCIEKGYGRGMSRRWGIKHFKLLEENLRDDEVVYMTFIGLKDYISMSKHDMNYAYAITNKRIMFGQKKVIGDNFKSVVLDRINDISSTNKLFMGIITIDTLGEIFNVGVDKGTAAKISLEVHKIIFDMRSGNLDHNNVLRVDSVGKQGDPITEIKKYKELLDMGIISDEEFKIKKRELLGL